MTPLENSLIWQKARRLAREIYAATELSGFCEDYSLKEHIRKTAVSVMSHLAQGFDAAGHGDVERAVAGALSACADIRAQLYVALDAGHLTRERFERLYQLTGEVTNGVRGLVQGSGPQQAEEK